MRALPPLLSVAACAGSSGGPPSRAAPPPLGNAALQLTGQQAVRREGGVVRIDGVRVVTPGGVVLSDAPRAGTRTIEADLVTPGFVDAHAHPIGLGQLLTEIDLVDAPSYAATLDRVGAAAGEGWLVGRGWDQNDWPDAPPEGWPRAEDLDRVCGDRPAVLHRVDGHAAWVNTAALAAAGLTAETPDPPGGRLIRDADGALTGVLIDSAIDLLKLPEPSVEQLERWLRAAQDAMLRSGLVGVHDMGVDDGTLAAYRRLVAADELRVHVSGYLLAGSDAAKTLLRAGPSREGRLHLAGIKAFADGALGSRGALLSSPYADEPETAGLALTSESALAELATRCLEARAQLAVHAIGDAAVTSALNAFASARRAVPEARDVPLRLEHAQVVRPADLRRFAELGVVASVQPTHATSDMPWAEERLGPERIRWAYAWGALGRAGATLALGSDFPVERVDPALGLWAATTRTDLEGSPRGGWQPDQLLSLDETIAGFTVTADRIVGRDGDRDLTAWRRLDGAPGWRAVATIVDGALAWSAED